jgi:hypothetical protein
MTQHDRRAGEKPSAAETHREERHDAERERENLDTQLDEELKDSFPASDPPSLTQEPR